MRKLFLLKTADWGRFDGRHAAPPRIYDEFRVCGACKAQIPEHTFFAEHGVCPHCRAYVRLNARERIRLTVDEGTFFELFGEMTSENRLGFPQYEEKLESSRKASGENEAVVTGTGQIGGEKSAIAVMDANFMMGSMGTVVGEKIVSLTEYARDLKLPMVIFCASGGARMQEGMYSLMQMTRCSVALKRHSEEGLFYISVLTHPTTGGVSASFAMQGDMILSEPGALIGFAGRGVIEGTIKQKLPEDFQKAEFMQEHGFIDAIVERKDLKARLSWLLRVHSREYVEKEGRRWIF